MQECGTVDGMCEVGFKTWLQKGDRDRRGERCLTADELYTSA